jgi:hypothetical protein
MTATATILNHSNAPRNFDAAFRESRPGPERDLVESFLHELPLSVPRGCHTTVFCEPRIDSGFPDLVIVIWNTAVARTWVTARRHLKREDIRLMHFLNQCGALSDIDLRNRIPRRIGASLARLEAAELLRKTSDKWIPRPLSKTFAARRIIAIEAKVSSWASVVGQAFRNTWFASDSFVLTPKVKQGSRLSTMAHQFGVGLFEMGQKLCCRKAAPEGLLPRSYVSWLFNEWAWRCHS